MNAPLWADRLRIVASVAASDAHRASELAAYLDRTLANAAKKAQNGPRTAKRYALGVEAGIRLAIGQLPAGAASLGRWNLTEQVMSWIATNGPAFFGLRRMPDVRVVRRVLRQMHDERCRKMGIATPLCLERDEPMPDARITDSPPTSTT